MNFFVKGDKDLFITKAGLLLSGSCRLTYPPNTVCPGEGIARRNVIQPIPEIHSVFFSISRKI